MTPFSLNFGGLFFFYGTYQAVCHEASCQREHDSSNNIECAQIILPLGCDGNDLCARRNAIHYIGVSCSAAEFCDKWSEAGPTHHMAAGVGRHIDTLMKVAKIFNIPVDIITR